MKAKKTRLVSRSFTLKEKHIRRIAAICSAHGQEVEISASCAGNLSLSTHDVDTLLDIENVGETEISEISFMVLNGATPQTYISLNKHSNYPIYYSLEGDQDEVLAIARKLDGVIALMVNGHGRFYLPIDMRKMIADAGMVVYPLSSIAMMVALGRNFRPMLFVLAWLVSMVMFFSNMLFNFFDPAGQFEVGRGGRDRIERSSQRRSQFGIGLLLAVVLGLLVNFFSHKLGW